MVLCEVMPSAASIQRPASVIKAMNEGYRAVARSYRNVAVLDTWTLFADARGDGNALLAYFPDHLHPNTEGYRRWAAALRPVLARLLNVAGAARVTGPALK